MADRWDRMNRSVARALGETITNYTRPSTGEVVPSLSAVFIRGSYRRERDPDGFDVSASHPKLHIRSTVLASLADPRPQTGDTFVADGATWVIDRKPDPATPGSYDCWCDEVNA